MAVDQVTQSILHAQQSTNGSIQTAPGATPTINSDFNGYVVLTGLTAAITGITVTGTPVNGQTLRVRFLDNGTPRALAFGAQFEAAGAALPTTTTASKRTTTTFLWDSSTAKWGSIASVVEA